MPDRSSDPDNPVSKAPVQLDRLLELLPGVVYRCRAEPGWPMEFISSAVRDLTGYTPAEFLAADGVLFGDLVHPDDRPALDAVVAESLREGRPFTASYRLCHRDGSLRHVLEQGMAVDTDHRGRLILEGYVADVTASRGLAEQLEATQAEFRALFESAPGCYLVLKPGAFTIVAASEAYLDVTHTTRQQLLHRGLFDVFPDNPDGIGADDSSNLRRSLERVQSTRRADAMAVQRYPIPRPAHLGGGFEERYWSPLNTPVLGPDGRVAYIIHRVEDVTDFVRQRRATPDGPVDERILRMEADIIARSRELQKANDQLRAAQQRIQDTFDSAAVGIAMLDPAGDIVLLNRAVVELLGGSEASLLITPFVAHVTPADRPRIARLLDDALSSGSHRAQAEIRVVRSDGGERLVRLSVSAVQHLSAQPRNLMLVLDDVTEERATALRAQQNATLLRIGGRMARVGGWAADLERNHVEWSQEIFEILEFPPGNPPPLAETLRLYPDEWRGKAQAALEGAAAGIPFDIEMEVLTLKGRRIWVRAVGEPERDADGRVVRVIGAFQDLSDIKAMEQRARTLSERLATTFESITDALFTLDDQWRFTFLNRRAEEVLQRHRDELLGRLIWDEYPAAVGSPIEAEYRKALQTGEACTFTAWYPDPLNRWYNITAYPSSQGLTVYFRDVTAERMASEAIRTGEERFRLLSRATNDAIWDWDLRSDQLWWNENYEQLFGRPRDSVSPTITSWSDYIHPEDHERVVHEMQTIIESGGSVFSGEYRFLRADGSYAWVLDRGHVIRNEAGEPVRMIGGMTDLTERIMAETRVAEQAALLDRATDAILVRDLEHRITMWSRGAESVYGWSREEALGQPVWQLLYRNPAPFYEATAAVLEHGQWAGELEHVTRQGEKRIIFGRWTLMRDRSGAPQSVLAINSDVTEQRKVERQLLRSQRLESIGTLAGGIAHDLNNVLAPVLMSIDLLRVESNPEVRDAILDTIAQSTRRGADLVQQVLAFARGVEGQRTPTQVSDICRDVAKIARDTFPKNIEIRLDLEEGLPQVLGDPTQLHQVLLNLCVNSRDAMPRGGDLRISARSSTVDTHYAALNPGATPGRHVVISVEDSGEGMPPEVLDKIFEPFFTTKELGRGTGLGLSTSQGIVRSHGGFLRAYSDPGHGTRMMIYLPAHEGDQAAAPDEVVVHLPRGQGELVLVVDDEPSVRQITRQTLEAFGYRVVTARDGAEAVSLFAQQHHEIAVVLTDMMMPVMDGLALIQVLLRIQPGVRVIAASGLNANGRTAKAADIGIQHFLAKPYTTELLLRMLREVLDADQPS